MKARFSRFLKLFALSLAIGGTAFGASKTLVTYEGGKVGAGIAKTWKKGKGNYTFVLDKTADVGQGDKPITAIVKNSLESKLGESNGVKVQEKGKDTVIISFTGDEKAFLEAVGKTRIRSEANVEIAMESTVSQGGVRAKTSERNPVDGEVKATVVKSNGDSVVVRVVTSSAKAQTLGIKDGDKVEVKAPGFKGAKGDPVFFMPTAKAGEVWDASSVKGN